MNIDLWHVYTHFSLDVSAIVLTKIQRAFIPENGRCLTLIIKLTCPLYPQSMFVFCTFVHFVFIFNWIYLNNYHWNSSKIIKYCKTNTETFWRNKENGANVNRVVIDTYRPVYNRHYLIVWFYLFFLCWSNYFYVNFWSYFSLVCMSVCLVFLSCGCCCVAVFTYGKGWVWFYWICSHSCDSLFLPFRYNWIKKNAKSYTNVYEFLCGIGRNCSNRWILWRKWLSIGRGGRRGVNIDRVV